MLAKLYQFLGSIKLAVPLLIVIGVILIAATFYESQVGSATVQRLIYKSPWFGGLMFLLALNLMVSALSRYPWRGPRKVGFVLTHLGLIVLIAGSAAVIHLGLEGMLPLQIEGGTNSTLRTQGEHLEVIGPDRQSAATEVVIKPDGSLSPARLGSLSLLAYSDNTVETIQFREAETGLNPAVHLELSSERMGQTVDQWLAAAPLAYRRISLGPAQLELLPVEGDRNLQRYLSQPLPGNVFQVLVTPDGKLYYHTQSAQGPQSGSLELRQSVSPGWADFQITAREFVPHARIDRRVQPVSDPRIPGIPALQVAAPGGTATWLPWNQPQVISDPQGDWLAAFSPNGVQLPFAIALEDFVVERNEGTDSVAMWTSNIQIHDPHTGEVVHRSVWMNHPTWYQGWKIAQASWNPENLRQSTLQVKREPLWVTALTWGGSLLVITGIALMFYGPALSNRRRQQPTSNPIPDPVPDVELESALP